MNCFSSKAFLADDNLGDSLDGVEALIRKHEDFDKSFAAQAEKVNVSTIIQIILFGLIKQCISISVNKNNFNFFMYNATMIVK